MNHFLAIRTIPKMTVRLMRLRTLRLGEFRFELRSFLDVLELPFLETYRYHTRGNVFVVDNVISLLHLSGIHLKQLTLVVAFPLMEDIKKLLDAIPCLQNLYLDIWCLCIASIIHELFEALSSSPPILVGNIPGFLPNLQSLIIFSPRISM